MALDRYYNLFDPAKRDEELMFRAGDGLQSRELNEMQALLIGRLTGIANRIFKDGDVMDGAGILVDPDTGVATLEAGTVYLRGAMRPVGAATLTIPTDARVAVGVRYTEQLATELEDVTLRDPAVGTDTFNEPGAARRRYALVWSFVAPNSNDGGAGAFHAIYSVTNGVLDNRMQPPAMDAVNAALARYDVDANGHYVTDGLRLAFVATESGEHVFSLSEGKANVNGFKINRPQAARLRFPVDPDTQAITSEPHVYNPIGGSMRVVLNRTPIHAVADVKVTKERTVTIQHGAVTGSVDTLPDATVVQILQVKQGATTYAPGTSYTLSGAAVDWTPGGPEPAPGSSYEVKYQYIDSVSIAAQDDDGFTVTGVVSGTTMYVDYATRLPRVDVLVMNDKGEVARVRGVSQVRNPSTPAAPVGTVAVASMAHVWRADTSPVVRNIAVRAIPMAEIEGMRSNITALFNMVATDRLRTDATIREAGLKKGVLADPFRTGEFRDAGEAQTAAVFGGLLALPISASVAPLALPSLAVLDHTLVPVVEQTQRTTSMLVNPYMAHEPLPAAIVLNPALDQFTITNVSWAETLSQSFTVIEEGYHAGGMSATSVSGSTEITRTDVGAAEFLRPLTVTYTASGFGPGEALAEITFDGIDVTPGTKPNANGAGTITGTFGIPANVPAGSKRVTLRGAGGSFGETTFVGRGRIVNEVRRQIVTTVTRFWDPLAQTVTLPEDRIVGGVDLWFTAKGTSSVIVQIKETQNGIPTQDVVTEGRVTPAGIALNAWTRVAFTPALLQANREYAIVVLCDDATTALAVAELGKYDTSTGWVTRQPYQIGVLLSSSNASTWTPHQDRDMAFRLLACDFTATAKEINLGTVNVTNASDFYVMAGVERPASACHVEFSITDAAGKVYRAAENQPINLTSRVTGAVTVRAHLRGTAKLSPVLHAAPQLVIGNLQETGDYVSRGVQADTSFTASVTLEALLPGTSTVKVFAESGSMDNWVELPLAGGKPADDGFQERTYKATGLSGVGSDKFTRFKVVLTGTAAHRSFGRALRALTL